MIVEVWFMDNSENNKNSFWNRHFENINDCEIFIKEAHWFLIAMAGLTFLFSILIQQFFILLPDVIFMTLLALLLKKYQSRTIAIIIFLYSLLLSIITFGNKLNLPYAKEFGGGTNIFLAAIFVYIAFKTMQATFKLYKFKNYTISWKNFLIKTFIFIILFLIFGFLAIIASIFVQNETILGLLVYIAIFLPMFIAYAGIFPFSYKLKIKQEKFDNASNN